MIRKLDVRVALVAAGLLGNVASLTAVAQDKGTGEISIDGSSTVAPIMSATQELFKAEQPNVKVSVRISGTGGGFKKFLDPKPELRIDIADASRPIKPSESSQAVKLGIEYIE